LKPGPPTPTGFGLNVVILGRPLSIVTDTGVELPPFGGGLKTEMLSCPGVLTSSAVSDTVNCVAETKTAGRSEPLTRATDAGTNLLPLIVTIEGVPVGTNAGLTLST